MPYPDVIDERFDDLVQQLASAQLPASGELRARVREIAGGDAQSAPRAERPRLRLPTFGPRRLLVVLAPLVVLVAVGGGLAGFLGAFSPSGNRSAVQDSAIAIAPKHGGVSSGPSRPGYVGTPPPDSATGGAAGTSSPAPQSGTVPARLTPTRGRAQDYQAQMSLRVKDLSVATKRALSLTRAFGGFVQSVDYGSGTRQGTAYLQLRVPIGSVQEAIVKFSALGSLLAQHVAIRDLQPTLDARFKLMQKLRDDITILQHRLEDSKLSTGDRTTLEGQLNTRRSTLLDVQQQQLQLQKRASFATVSLELQSVRKAPSVIVPVQPGPLRHALDRAGRILLGTAVVGLYVAVVGGPFLALLLMILLAERLRRRRSLDRLLSRSA